MKKYKKILALFFTLTSVLTLCACSKGSEELSIYQENMTYFFDNVEQINEKINNIDTAQEGYDYQLLGYLDILTENFDKMAELEVPSQFPYVKELAVDAASNLHASVDLYHEIFEDVYDQEKDISAYSKYCLANKELQYIIRILHGETYEEIVASSEDQEN